MDYVSLIGDQFEQNGNRKIAERQESFLKNKFQLFGIMTPLRKEIQKPYLTKQNLPAKADLTKITEELWAKSQREFHYFAIDLNRRYIKKIEFEDIHLFEKMIVNNSWWDTVDLIAINLVGNYFKLFPEQIQPVTLRWLETENLWLQRTCLIFQLKYKEAIDTKLLSDYVLLLKDTKEFFLNKAIGWVLREYTRTNPEWVLDFVGKYELSNLSRKEALRLIN